MKKIITVLGARPQFIKAAAVSRAIARQSTLQECIVHTGRHGAPGMPDIFFEEMDIPQPAHRLGVGGGSHGRVSREQLQCIETLLLNEKPDWVLVYGDAHSTLSGAVAAARLNIPVAHVEAGLRSFDLRMPGEINRVLVDHLSALLFAPTDAARRQLEWEGVAHKHIYITGDVMMDATLHYRRRARKPVWFDALGIDGSGFLLCFLHRADNTDSATRLRDIFLGLAASARPVIVPLHPHARRALERQQWRPVAWVRIVEPVGYLERVWLEMHCRAVITDSGGIQKEAYFHGKPCITLREETELTELVALGANTLVGADPERIARTINEPAPKSGMEGMYGDGRAAHMIARILAEG